MLPAMPSRDRRKEVSMRMNASRKITPTVNTARPLKSGTFGSASVSSTML